MNIQLLTVASFFDSFFVSIYFSESFSYDHHIKKYPQELTLIFQWATFGSIKISENEIFPESEPEMTILDCIPIPTTATHLLREKRQRNC